MTSDVCKECGNPLHIDEDWILRDPSLIGTEASGPLGEAYMHRECASPGHVELVLGAEANQ